MEDGDVCIWLRKLPWLLLKSCQNDQLLHWTVKKLDLGLGPAFIRASFDTEQSEIAESKSECWLFEWIEGEHRKCRIRTLSSTSGYWRMVKSAQKNTLGEYDVLLQEYPDRDAEGAFLHIENKIMRPSIFNISILDSKIAIQHDRTKLWLSVSQKGTLNGLETFSDTCFFRLTAKISFAASFEEKCCYVTTNTLGKQITCDSLWLGKKQTFFLFMHGSYITIYAPSCSKFWNSDANGKGGLKISDTPGKFHLGGGVPLWQLFIEEKVNGKLFYINQSPEKHLYISKAKPTSSALLVDSRSSYQLFLLPSKDDSTLALSRREIQYLELKGLFGTELERIPSHLCHSDGIPIFLFEAITYISAFFSSEGLFRISGSTDRIRELKIMIDSGLPLQDAIAHIDSRNGPNVNVDDVCALFKVFFRDMPCPLVGTEVLSLCLQDIEDTGSKIELSVGIVTSTVAKEKIRNVSAAVNSMKSLPRSILATLCCFLNQVASHSQSNKMTTTNLALVFAPNLSFSDFAILPGWRDSFGLMVAAYPFIFATQELE